MCNIFRYRLVAYNWSGSKICAVIACTNETVESCGRLLNSTDVKYKEPVLFEKIEIEVPDNVTGNHVFVPSGLYRNFEVLNTTDYTFETSGSEGSLTYKMSYRKPYFQKESLLTFAAASDDYYIW